MAQKARAMDQLAASSRKDAYHFFHQMAIWWTSWSIHKRVDVLRDCDAFTFGTVANTAAQDHSVEGHYTMEPELGDCVET